jgi:hypothetical protein
MGRGDSHLFPLIVDGPVNISHLLARDQAPTLTLLISAGITDLRAPNADSRVTIHQYGLLLPQRLVMRESQSIRP